MPKRNRKSGRPRGTQPGSRHHVTDGMRSAAMTENRRVFWALMQAASKAIRECREPRRERTPRL